MLMAMDSMMMGGAPAPAAAGLLSVGGTANASNMVATVIASSLKFSGNTSVTLTGIAPVVTYFSGTPEWRAGRRDRAW